MGFSDLQKMRERLQAIPLLIPALIGDAVVEYEEIIADLNREQLEKGETPEMAPIRPPYRNPAYARMKQAKNPKPAFKTPDLILTGAFVGSIKVYAFVDSFELRANDKKTKDLLKKYGAVVGLSPFNIGRVQNEIVKPYLQRKIKSLFV